MTATSSRLVRSGLVFLDGLGTEAAASDEQRAEEFLDALVAATKRVAAHLRIDEEWEAIHWQLFSDLLCLSVGSIARLPLQALTLSSAVVQREFAVRGVFLRGAMTLGKFYRDDNIAFGPALTAAYRLERQYARHPRVILDPDASRRAYARPSAADAILPVARDEDGALFIDFLQVASVAERARIRKQIEAECDRIVRDHDDQIVDHTKLPQNEKLIWLARYYNWRVKPDTPIRLPAPSIIEISSYERWRTRRRRRPK